MHGWFLIQTFYHGLKRTSREHLDAAAGGAIFSLQAPTAKELIEKMVANKDWDGDRLQPRTAMYTKSMESTCSPPRWTSS
jgi:hypothetical protein